MAFGRKVGPTGRKRDEFSVGAWNKQGKNAAKRETRYGNATLDAYGQEGVREAKRHVHARNPHRWVKFSVMNESRMGRERKKKNEAIQKVAPKQGDKFYQIIVKQTGPKPSDYRISRDKAEVKRMVAGYRNNPKVTSVRVFHGTKNSMKEVQL